MTLAGIWRATRCVAAARAVAAVQDHLTHRPAGVRGTGSTLRPGGSAQATGGDGVDKRIDVIATAIRAGMTVDDLADLELAYSPPFGSAKDPVNLAGMAASNVLAGDLAPWRADDLLHTDPGAVLLDVRSASEFRSGHLPGALNIPHTELRQRVGEIPRDHSLLVYCSSGFRSYLALRLLRQNGWSDVRSLSGGLSTLQLERPSLASDHGEPTAELARTGRP